MGGAEEPAVSGRLRAGRDRSETRLRALSDIGRAGVGAPSTQAVRLVLLAAMRALDGDAASLGIWEEGDQLLRVTHNVGALADWEEAEPGNEVYTADQSSWLGGLTEGLLGAVLSLDDPDLAPDDREYLTRLGKHSSISIPVLYAGQWWGELFASRIADRPPFSKADLEWGTAVAAQVGAALETLEHLDRIGRLAQTDPLTGLANRRALDEWLDQALVELREQGRPVGLLVCDLNGLKRINDEQGHDAGDRALVQFTAVLTHAQRALSGSIVARLGGDEFCLAVSGTDVEGLDAASQEICRSAWETLPFGVACGMVSTAEPIGPIDNGVRLFRLADAAQYRAKRTGSRVPVVAGRALPAELAVPLSDLSNLGPPDRRLLRGRDGTSMPQFMDAALRALDQAGHDPVRPRLGLVADLLTHHIDALGWWISFAAAGSSVLRTAEYAVYRAIPGLTEEDIAEGPGESFELATYPQSAMAMRGGSFTIHVEDLTADPAELAILDGLKATAVIGAGGTDPDGDRWLIEIFTDELSVVSPELAGAIRLLVLAALHPPADAPGG